MNQVMQTLISRADAMGLTTESGSGTADTSTTIGNVRVYRERNASCVNMKRLKLKTSWKLNDKAIAQEKLIAALT